MTLHYMLIFLTPESHLEVVKNAVFAVGAGSLGKYQQCAWQTLGEGQFMPLPGSNAFVGEVNQLEKIAEYRVEIICPKERIKDAVAAMKKAHPYESPAYQILSFETL